MGLQSDIQEYMHTVCSKDGSKNFIDRPSAISDKNDEMLAELHQSAGENDPFQVAEEVKKGTEVRPLPMSQLGNSDMLNYTDHIRKVNDPSEDKKEEEEDMEHVPHDKNSVIDIYQWAINEYHELQSVHLAVKYYLKYATKIKAYSQKYRIDLSSIPGNILLEGDLNIESNAAIDATDKLDFTEANQLSFENLQKDENLD